MTTVRLPHALPRLQVEPEGGLGSVSPGLRPLDADVDLESLAFNRRFRVRTDDRRYAVDVLTPRTMAAMLSTDPADSVSWRIDGADLAMFGDYTSAPATIVDNLTVVTDVARHIPSFLYRNP